MALEPIIGTEVEYGITVAGDESFNPVAASALVVNAHRDGGARIRWSYDDETPGRDARGFTVGVLPVDETDSGLINSVLLNGARLYVDHAHPEYSTPECGDPLEATLHDKAGERVMQTAASAATEMLPEGQRLLLHKNNSDGKGNSYGAHENYLVARSVPFGSIVHHLTSFLVSRQILTGSGKIGSEHARPDVDYQISQRADFFEEEIGLETTLKRPIINTRDEPHADAQRYRRLHVIFGDATLSEVQTLVKLGATSLMLMALEDGRAGDPIVLRDPVGSITHISHDISLGATVALEDGTTITARDLQWRFFAVAERYVMSTDLAPAYKQVLDEWRSLLEDLEGGWEPVSDRLDWAAKLSVLEAYRDRDGLGWNDPKLRLVGLQFHDIDPNRGLFHRLVASNRVRRLFTDQEVAAATTTPPEATRAFFRGACLRQYGSAVVAANWDSLVFDTGASTLVRVPMMEPRRGTKALVEHLLAASEDAAALINNIGDTNE
ncbi:MAG: depupylase/deamidase Dop [Acidimicrobiia bacterium]